MAHLRTVPTFVTAHIFCASRKASIALDARAKGNLLAQNDEFNFATKRPTKMQENFGWNEIQLMDILNQEQRKSNISVSP